MKRRNFIHNTALGSLLTTFGLASCSTTPIDNLESAPNDTPFPLEEYTVEQLQKEMNSGQRSARSIAELYIERINKIDKNRLNAVIELNPEALTIADKLDKERASGIVRGPLHGIPVMIKDNIDTGDQMMTTAGSLALVGPPAPKDAFIVSKLRKAGAVLLGKTNLSEWANFRSERSSSGWSSRGRQTKNPFALDRDPCGSSSGSGVAVSANLCTITVGTETDGSIVCPASANGIVGIKPTVGLWSRTGIIPISHTQDTAGPMGRTVADAAALLGPLTGVDAADRRTSDSKNHSHPDYTEFLDKDGLQGKRIGVWREAMGFHEKVDLVMKDAFKSLEASGAEIIDPVEIVGNRQVGRSGYDLMLYEFKQGINQYLLTRSGLQVKSLHDIIEFNEANRDRSMPYFEQERFFAVRRKRNIGQS